MIQLENVSKFYHNKNLIATGISRVNLELKPGEFVVITGESGSGKTTLLNVISGLDSYEEGEMYIDGEETSHYMAADFEEYRKKYIGNVFQNFNLVNSYTVRQNVDLVLRINGWDEAKAARRVDEIIRRVGLSDFADTKASKLSGGQMQRVAIARALARDTEIIVADEPTGNLDSKAAGEIAQLLSEISRNKLVIVVTHNFDQFEQYATRCIKMHDGKVVENTEIRPPAEGAETKPPVPDAGHMSASSKILLGIRNTFNIGYKFALLLIVFLFLVFAVTSQYTSYLNQKAENSKLGYNNYFYNYSDDRVVLKKKDGSQFTDNDYKAIRTIDNIGEIVANDILLDTSVYIEEGSFSYEAFPRAADEFKGKLYKGRMPEKGNEVLLAGQEDQYTFSKEKTADLIGKTFTINIGEDQASAIKVKIVGIAFEGDEAEYQTAGNAYMTQELMSQMLSATYYYYSTITTTINGKAQEYQNGNQFYKVLPSSKVDKGKILLPSEAANFFDKKEAKGKTVTVSAENMYYDLTLPLKVSDTYTEKTFSYKSNYRSYNNYGGAVFISQTDYDSLFAQGNYQSSVFVRDTAGLDSTMESLKNMGYICMPLKDAKVRSSSDLTSMIQVPVIIVIMVALFFIAYFVIRLILRSRTGYFSILRMLGLAKSSIRRILDVELFAVLNIAYLLFLIAVILVNRHIINIEYMSTLIQYMRGYDYLILYVILAVMSWLISGKFARRLFRKTAIGSFRGEE